MKWRRPNDSAVLSLAGAVLLEVHDEWAIARRRHLVEGSMALLIGGIPAITLGDVLQEGVAICEMLGTEDDLPHLTGHGFGHAPETGGNPVLRSRLRPAPSLGSWSPVRCKCIFPAPAK